MTAGLIRLVYDAALHHPAPEHSQHSGAVLIYANRSLAKRGFYCLRKGENIYEQ